MKNLCFLQFFNYNLLTGRSKKTPVYIEFNKLQRRKPLGIAIISYTTIFVVIFTITNDNLYVIITVFLMCIQYNWIIASNKNFFPHSFFSLLSFTQSGKSFLTLWSDFRKYCFNVSGLLFSNVNTSKMFIFNKCIRPVWSIEKAFFGHMQ